MVFSLCIVLYSNQVLVTSFHHAHMYRISDILYIRDTFPLLNINFEWSSVEIMIICISSKMLVLIYFNKK